MKKSMVVLFLVASLGLVYATSVALSGADNSSKMYVISGYVFDPSGNFVAGAFTYNTNSTGQSVGPRLLF